MRLEKVSGHRRTIGRGRHKNKLIPISSFKRKAKPIAHKNIHPMKREYGVIYYQDDQGRIVSKRKYRRLR